MESSIGLGLVNTIITYPASLLLQLPQRAAGKPNVIIAFPIFGVLSTILYTYFYYPYRMSHRFIFSSLVYMQLFSMLWRGILLLFNAAQRTSFTESLNLFSTATKDSLISVPLNFLIQIIIWYSVILVSNRIAVHWFTKEK